MAYIVDPTDPTQPTGDKGATQGAGELRALKAYIATLAGLGPTGLGVNVFRKNAIIGGDFDTNPWQRGNAFVGAVNGSYSADRFKYTKGGTMTQDINKVADAPLLGAVLKNRTMDVFAINCLQLNVTAAEVALAAGDFSMISHLIEGYNWKLLAQVPLVLSFWHKHTKIGTYCVAIQNAGADRSYIAEYQQVVTNTWEYDSVIIPASPLAGTWLYTNGLGASINFVSGSGATFQTPAGVWTIGNFIASANQVNSLDTIGNKFQIALAQLERGTVASSFERRTFQEELFLCQRYYEKSFYQQTVPVQAAGANNSELIFIAGKAGAGGNVGQVHFKVVKRTSAPALIFYNPSALNAQVRDLTGAVDCTGTAFQNKGDEGFAVSCVGNAGTAIGNVLGVNWTADAEL